MKKGTLYGVSVGPGDPELLTRKALNVMERCPVVAVPVTRPGHSLAWEIAADALDLGGKTRLDLPFPMTADVAERCAAYESAWALLEPRLSAGEDAAMPCLGDVSVYATFEGVRALAEERGFPTEAVPGVPSFCAAAARLGVGLASGDETLHIVPGGGDVGAALDLPGTKVFLKMGRDLPALLEVLEDHGLSDRAMLVKNCGLPGEKAMRALPTAKEAAELGYFVTVIVKEREK